MATELAQRKEQTVAPAVPTFEALIGQAIQAGAPVETMERLLDMRERLRQEQARAEYFEALSAFQADAPSVPKTKTATIQSDRGSYSYHYAPLEVIVETLRPHLRAHGLSYRFDTAFEMDPPAQYVTCTVTHVGGHSESSSFRTPVDARARMNDMQKSASAQTYAKRYALSNALGIVTADEDDDGHGAYVRPAQQPTPPVFDPGPMRQPPRPAPHPIKRGQAVPIPGGDVQHSMDETAAPDPDDLGLQTETAEELRSVAVALATEYLLRTNSAAQKLGPKSPAVPKKAREWVAKYYESNFGEPFEMASPLQLEHVVSVLKRKLDG